jgi:hypothetical protein
MTEDGSSVICHPLSVLRHPILRGENKKGRKVFSLTARWFAKTVLTKEFHQLKEGEAGDVSYTPNDIYQKNPPKPGILVVMKIRLPPTPNPPVAGGQ